MKHRMLRYAAGWEWHLLNIERTERTIAAAGPGRPPLAGRAPHDEANPVPDGFRARYPDCAGWLAAIQGREDNHIAVSETADGSPCLQGTLLFQATEDPNDIQTVHYWVSPDMMVTAQTDLRLAIRLQQAPWSDRLERCAHAPEAFAVLLSAAAEPFHAEMERLEKTLSELQRRLGRMRSAADRAASLLEFRYGLLRASHLLRPVRELESAMKEAFLHTLTGLDGYVRLACKLERIEQLLKRYGEEAETLTSMQETMALTRRDSRWRPAAFVVAAFAPALTALSILGLSYRDGGRVPHPMMLAFAGVVVILLTAAVVFTLWRGGAAGSAAAAAAQFAAAAPPAAGPSSSGNPAMDAGGPLPGRPRRRRTHTGRKTR